jgi:two-component system, sensor histidine kinase and response regulator
MKADNENAGIKILVVEDSRTQAEYIRHILETEGYTVALAVNGNDALEQIRIDRPAMVLTDILMPEMDGFALCRAIKQNGNMADIPVILVTQLFDPADLKKGLEAGADNIIIKPFEAKHVKVRITSTLRSRCHPDSNDAGAAPAVSLEDQQPLIPASQLRSPEILLTAYEIALRKNYELQEVNASLVAENERLQQTVGALQRANEKLRREDAGL